MSMCPMCSAELPSSCLTGLCDSKTTEDKETPSLTQPESETTSILDAPDPASFTDWLDNEDQDLPDEGRGSARTSRGRPKSRRHGSDSQSSGRKEAAKLYPLNEDAPCEWQGLANCGGGDFPIIGCPSEVKSIQQARHHGPEKNVQNNEVGNVHRICHYCHYRWHAKNDKTYDWNAGIWIAHQPRPMLPEEKTFATVDYMRYLTKGKRKKVKVED